MTTYEVVGLEEAVGLSSTEKRVRPWIWPSMETGKSPELSSWPELGETDDGVACGGAGSSRRCRRPRFSWNRARESRKPKNAGGLVFGWGLAPRDVAGGDEGTPVVRRQPLLSLTQISSRNR